MFKFPNPILKDASQAMPKQNVLDVVGRVFSWTGLGVVLLAILLAKWTWVFLAPASPSVPATTGWKKTEGADQLFGAANMVGASGVSASPSLGDIRLIGVFAHKTKGFAVMEVENKQIGVALGEQVAPGVRLLETHSDYVMVDRGGKQQRIDLMARKAVPNTSTTSTVAKAMTATNNVPSAPPALPQTGRTIDIEAATAAMAKLPPDQREALRRQLGMIRGKN